MTTIVSDRALFVCGVALLLGACGEQRDDNAATTTTLDAVDVPQGTISDSIVPLDARDDPPATPALSNETQAPPATAPANEASESETE